MKITRRNAIGILASVSTAALEQEAAAQPANAVAINWLGGAPPSIESGVSWGIPWPRGAVRKDQSFTLTAGDGRALPLQTWPLAYWPDGSMKWIGYATVAGPNTTGALRLAPGAASPATAIRVGQTAQSIDVDTVALQCRVSKQGADFIDSMTVGGRVVARQGRLVCTLDNGSEFTSSIKSATLEQSGPVRAVVKKEAGAKPVQKTVGNILYTPRVEKVLALSVGYAEYLGHAFVGTEHLLLALLREGGGSGARILKESGVDIELTREHILKELAPEANPAAEPLASNAPLFPIPAVEKATHNFTPRAQQVLALARTEAARFNHDFVGVEHLLLGLIRLGQGVAVNVLQKLGLDLETVRTAVKKALGTGPDQKMIGNIPYTPRVKSVLKLAAEEAKNLNHTYVGTEHILLGVLREGNSLAVRIMKDLHVDIEKTRLEILKELNPNFASGAEPQAGG